MARRALVVAALAFGLAACATIDVSSDYDAEADFARLRSFALLPDPPASGNPRADNPLIHRRVRRAIADELERRGYAPSDTPDMKIGYHVSTEQRLDVRTVDSYYGYGWRYGVAGLPVTTTEVRQYEQGALIIDVVDAKTDTLVWRGVGEARLRSDPSPEQITERVNLAVQQILAEFPPGAGD
ncbi:MAG: DUF4136 domain-containing protein [Myxococcota bacterium]